MSRREEINQSSHGNITTTLLHDEASRADFSHSSSQSPIPEETNGHSYLSAGLAHTLVLQLRSLSTKHVVIIGICITVLVVTAYVAYSSSGAKTSAYCATSSISAGTEISQHVKPCHIPHDLLPEDADLSSSEIAEARAAGDIASNEIITRLRLSDPQLPSGWRAVTMHSDTGAAASPGTHAELIVTAENSTTPPQVLCTDSIIRQKSITGQATVLVAMPQQCAHKLAQLPEHYVVSLLLR